MTCSDLFNLCANRRTSMKPDKNAKRDAELTQFFSGVKESLSEDKYAGFFKTIQTGYDSREALFDAAGIDKDIVHKLQETIGREDVSLHSACDLVAPELRKLFGVEFDPESGTPEIPLFKKTEHNLFDDIGMDNEKLSDFLATFVKCYQDDTDEDWQHLSQIMLEHADKFFAPSYKKAKEAGLLESEEDKTGGKQ